MNEFLIGFLVGVIVAPLLLAVIAKPLMKWFLKRQATKLTENVMGRMKGLGDNFNQLNKNKEEKNGFKIEKEEKD